MAKLSTAKLALVDRATRRAVERLAGAELPLVIGIDVAVTAHEAIAGILIGHGLGVDYELDDLAPETIRGAVLDALDIALHGARAWRRL